MTATGAGRGSGCDRAGQRAAASRSRWCLKELVIGIRPEHLHLAGAALRGEVMLVEELGAGALLHVGTGARLTDKD